MIELFPEPEPRKPNLLRVGKTEYQFPLAATEIHILDDRGNILWKTQRQGQTGPIRWKGVDTEGKVLASGDYVCKLSYPDGESIYIPFLFTA